MVRNFSDIEREDADGKSLIYESSYGRYEIENNALVLKEKYISTTERKLELLDIAEPEAAPQFRAFCKMHLEGEYVANFARTFRSERGVYFLQARRYTVGYKDAISKKCTVPNICPRMRSLAGGGTSARGNGFWCKI